MNIRRFKNRCFLFAQKTTVFVLFFVLAFSDLQAILSIAILPTIERAEASVLPAIKVESFDQDVTTDGSTFTLSNDVGATSSAFIKMNTGTRKTSAGPTGSTANTAPDVGTVGLVLTDTDTITVERANATEVKVMGEVWRYEGPAGGGNEFIVRDRVAVSLVGASASLAISGISDVDKVVPFVTGYTVNDNDITNWEYAAIAAHMDDSGNLVVSRNNAGTAATVYVDVVEFTGSQWNVCHGYSGSHDSAAETVTLNTDSDGQGGSTCDVVDWGTATIIEATMEGDSFENGLSDVLALVRPGANTTSVVFDVHQDAAARNDGEAWLHVLQNDELVVTRTSNADLAEGSGSYSVATWPSGATTTAPIDTLALEWFSDTDGVGTAHMRGGLHARITNIDELIYSDGDPVDSSQYISTLEAYFEGELTFAATPTGVIYEAGGTGDGAFVGYNDAGDFIIRAGDGGSTSPNNAARIVITSGDYDFSGRTGTLAWNFIPADNAVSLSFDDNSNGSVDYATTTTAVSAWTSWAGTDGGFVGNADLPAAGSEITSGYDFNGTIDEVRFRQSSSSGYEVSHWVHRDGNVIGAEYGVIELAGLASIPEAIFITATGTHTTQTNIPVTNFYAGGSFVITENAATRNVNSITVTESGTVDGSTSLDNIRLFYDLDTSGADGYDCSSESYQGNESQFGSTDTNGFSGADGIASFSGSVSISNTQTMCVYVIYDVTSSAEDGDTVVLSIDNPVSDIGASGAPLIGPALTVSPSGFTSLQSAELTQTHYHWRNDDGTEVTATSIEGAEDTATRGFANGITRRLRIGVSAEGSTSSPPVAYRLEYGQKVTTCSAIDSWTDVGTGDGGDWDVVDSANLTDGNNTTDIAVPAGGLSNPPGKTFFATNGAQKDTSSETNGIALSSSEFVELEYAIEPTVTASEGNTYCFRVSDAGTALKNYNVYAEGTVSADIDVSASSSQVASLDAGSVGQYVGGVFVIQRIGTSRTLTDVTLTETGTVDASAGLENPTLYYDLDITAPYDCTGESYAPTDSSIAGSAFSGANGTTTFTGSITLDSTQTFCGYLAFDITSGAGDNNTIKVEINDPSVDVVVTGSSVGPSTSVSPVGSTTIAGPVLAQTHYHWRDDGGTEALASSVTGGIEDTALLDVPRLSTQRLRIQVSNEGSVASAATQYRLEYGTKITTCDAVDYWQDIDTGASFQMSSSSLLVDGGDTTDVATSTGGVSNPSGKTFVTSNGGQKEDTSQTGDITLSSTQYVELEYAIESTANSAFDTTYCFRVTDSGDSLDSYTTFAELTTREKQDFYVQRGVTMVSGVGTTLTAGVDYIAPSASTSAFFRITNTQMTGAGNDSGGGSQSANTVTAYVSNPENIETSITISRPPTATNDTRVAWEIIEFVGLEGSDNEMIVRDHGVVTYGATSLTATGTPLSNISDDAQVVVFVTGQLNPDTGRDHYNDGLSTSQWNESLQAPVFTRADADLAVSLSYVVVEYVGVNWNIQRVEHQYVADGVTETESITALGSLSRTFMHAQKRVGDALTNLDEYGAEVWLSSIGAASFVLESGATTPSDHHSVVWIIENTQTGTGAMTVQRSNGVLSTGSCGGLEPCSEIISISPEVKTSNASLFATNRGSGAGSAHPRTIISMSIASSSAYEAWRSDTGQTQTFRTEIIQWPVAEISIRQHYYRFYADNNALIPTDAWPIGVTDLGENTSISSIDEPLGDAEVIRIRMSLFINNASMPENSTNFKLQFGKRVTSCSAVDSNSTWVDLGAPGSGSIWRGYDTSVSDGTSLATSTPAAGTLLITGSTVAGTYEEQNNTQVNPYSVDIGEIVEYDWAVEHNGALQRTDYCFRMTYSDGSELNGYDNYPTLRTTGYTPVIGDWRWYEDETNETPVQPLANENTAPADIENENKIKLRVLATEVENAVGSNIKFGLQYSQYPDFNDGGHFITSSLSCTENSIWCYADGAGEDNAVIATTTLFNADACSFGAGEGCGTHNELLDSASTLTQAAASNMEFEFTISQAGARANGVYYFRLYDMTNDDPLVASSSYPSLVTEGAQLVFSLSGLTAGAVIDGETMDVTSTTTTIPYGSLPFDTEYVAGYRLNVDTNATEGYQVLMLSDQQLINAYGSQIAPVSGDNLAPTAWGTGCLSEAVGCFGYHVEDDVLANGSTRFALDDSYAALSTTPQEVMYSSIPTEDTHDIVYKLQISQEQPAGDYETSITFISIPIF